jgi:hypothetical protein
MTRAKKSTEAEAPSAPAGRAALEDWFRKKGFKPWPFQTEAWDAFDAGDSGLIHVPTGSGKTLAAFGGPLSHLRARGGLQVLYLSPLRAVIRDIEVAVREVCDAICPEAIIETRTGDTAVIELIRRAIHDPDSEVRIAAERAFLARMGGSCQTPLAAHAIDQPGGAMRIVGLCGMPDGSKILRAEVTGPARDAEQLGQRLGDDLLAQGADRILAATK